MSPIKYDCEAVRNCKVHVIANYSGRYRLPKRADNPFKIVYDPELDMRLKLEPDRISQMIDQNTD